ncbi:biogenesis of lysosome-related organelles complex 1 subunit 3 [Halyomorpha halys]|uniref:biogenesis of lysosome-related organelles complex 1 subunit 3 n=1 Tax=Halyomorpha halys TaxID=286706 RepID=UPI0006D4E0D0|nr:uncharacterized protein LOC106689679 [Halyomorpha halys]
MLGKSSYIVLGEASESDEDEHNGQETPSKSVSFANKIVSGEASESETEVAEEYNITAEAFKAKAEEAQYNSLLHKKLRESNHKLKDDLNQLVMSHLKFASHEVNEINQRLLVNQIEIQDTVKYLRKSAMAVTKVDSILSYLLCQNFLPSINIDL